MVFYVVFLRDVARQKLLKSANVSRSYSQNNTGTVFFETRCRWTTAARPSLLSRQACAAAADINVELSWQR